ncbi:MAG: hypothetical protein C0502_04575 [Opitutus sp.]|nr:hypothetical protein [Opitutus sp.]
MKHPARLSALAAAVMAATASAAPFVALGDNAELFLTASVSVSVDDNIYLRSSGEVDDTILRFVPGLDLVFGQNAATSGNVYYKHEFRKYTDVSKQDTDLANVGVNSLYENGKSKLDFGLSYAEAAQNEPSAPGFIVDSNRTSLRAIGEFGATEKTTFGGGVRFEKTNYDSANLTDNDIWTVPLDVYFEYSPKLQASLGYRYRSTELRGSAIGSKDHFLNIGARGEFTPKLNGQIRFGYVTRKFDNGRDDSSLGADADLTYAATAKTAVRLGLSNDYGSAATGASTKTTAFNAGLSTKVDEQWSWNVNLAYRAVDYSERSDDFFQGGIGVDYTYNSFVKFSGSFTRRSNRSDSKINTPVAIDRVRIFEFDNNVFAITADIRY